MRRYDPRAIVDNLNAQGTDSEQTESAPWVETFRQKEILFEHPDPAGPEFPRLSDSLFRREILPALRENIDIGRIEPGTRFGFLKRLIQRLIRPATGRQVVFNYNMANAIRVLVEYSEVLGATLYDRLALMKEEIDAKTAPPATPSDSSNQMLQTVLNELRRIDASRPDTGKPNAPSASLEQLADDLRYHLYEENWRGTAEDIQERQSFYIGILQPYLDQLDADKRVVLDVGFGRGEFLKALRQRGLQAKGLEINHLLVESARSAGLDVEAGDAISHLENQPENQYGALVAFQVLEHFSPPVLRHFLDLAYSRLQPGGIALFETLNPESFSAYRWYFMDLTHRIFLPAETLRFAGECSRFKHLETQLIHPVSSYEQLTETGTDQERENIRRLNSVLFGPQDYYILLQKPLEATD